MSILEDIPPLDKIAMSILEDIPPLDKIAPHFKQLKLIEPPDRDQSDRSVSLISYQYYLHVYLYMLMIE